MNRKRKFWHLLPEFSFLYFQTETHTHTQEEIHTNGHMYANTIVLYLSSLAIPPLPHPLRWKRKSRTKTKATTTPRSFSGSFSLGKQLIFSILCLSEWPNLDSQTIQLALSMVATQPQLLAAWGGWLDKCTRCLRLFASLLEETSTTTHRSIPLPSWGALTFSNSFCSKYVSVHFLMDEVACW